MASKSDEQSEDNCLLDEVIRNPHTPASIKNLLEYLTLRVRRLEDRQSELEHKIVCLKHSEISASTLRLPELERYIDELLQQPLKPYVVLDDNDALSPRLSDLVLQKDVSERFVQGFLESYEEEPVYEHIDSVSGRILNAKEGNEIFNLGGQDNHLSTTGKRVLENTLSGAFTRKLATLKSTPTSEDDLFIDFKKEREHCLLSQQLFVDSQFPADDSSIFENSSLPETEQTEFQRKFRNCVWLRPSEIVSHPKFFVHAQSRFDAKQGGLGDCYLVASVATLTMHEELFYRVVPLDQSFTQNYAGIFHFQFWHFGEWVDVVIDDRLPTKNGELVFTKSDDRNEFWSALLEKAYAKLYGGYELLIGGSLSDVMEDLTGGIVECYRVNECTEILLKALMEHAYFCGSMINCGTAMEGVDEDKNLFAGHAYSCTGFAKVFHKTLGTVQLVRIRNPWGSKLQWTGPWGDDSDEWNLVSDTDKRRLEMVVADDGEFWMSFDDFFREFSTVNICSLSKECVEEICKMVGGRKMNRDAEWTSITMHGHWSAKCSTAGDHVLDALLSNPQYLLTVQREESVEKNSRVAVIVELLQRHLRGKKKSAYEAIGFFVFEVGSQLERLTIDNACNVSIAIKPVFMKSREMTKRIYLYPGNYLLIPATYTGGHEGDFLLRLFSSSSVGIRPL